MVHKKYTYKDGRRYGPYLYETKRVNGKVVTRYVGKGKEEKVNKKFVMLGLAGVFLVLLLFFGFYFGAFNGVTGNVLFDVNDVYKEGDALAGNLRLSMGQGELIPADSVVLVTLGNESKEFLVSELAGESTKEGGFYLEGFEISGSGEGYGLEGTRAVYPEIDFELVIISEDSQGSESGGSGRGEGPELPEPSGEPTGETGGETGTGSEPGGEPSSEPIGGESGGEPSGEPTGGESSGGESSSGGETSGGGEAGSGESSGESGGESGSGESGGESSGGESGGSGITGAAISEEVIRGSVSKDEPFTYNLGEGEDFELVEGSVMHEGEGISESNLIIEENDGEIEITTEYGITEEGFGEEFLGDETYVLEINIENLGFVVSEDSTFSVVLSYEDIVLAEAEKEINLEDAEIVDGENETGGSGGGTGLNETLNETIVNETESNETEVNGTEINETILNETELNESFFNVSELNGTGFNVEIIQGEAVLGQPVRWIKRIEAKERASLDVELPQRASNVSVRKVSEASARADAPGTNVSEERKRIRIDITGDVVSDSGQGLGWLARILRFTGFFVSEEGNEVEIEAEEDEVFEVEYYTQAPYSSEEDINGGKRIVVSGSEEVHYKDVLVFTNLSEGLMVRSAERVNIHWAENDTDLAIKEISDTDGNGIYDYIEWIAPQLSNQTFFIYITGAEHLDENRSFISDIFEEVRELDGNWSEEIPQGHFVRVTFEKNLTSVNDITVYPRTVNGTPRIEIFEENGTEIIAEFENLTDNEYNKVFLTGLNGTQDTFDLNILNGSVEFDHIIDPGEGHPGVTISTIGQGTCGGSACNYSTVQAWWDDVDGLTNAAQWGEVYSGGGVGGWNQAAMPFATPNVTHFPRLYAAVEHGHNGSLPSDTSTVAFLNGTITLNEEYTTLGRLPGDLGEGVYINVTTSTIFTISNGAQTIGHRIDGNLIESRRTTGGAFYTNLGFSGVTGATFANNIVYVHGNIGANNLARLFSFFAVSSALTNITIEHNTVRSAITTSGNNYPAFEITAGTTATNVDVKNNVMAITGTREFVGDQDWTNASNNAGVVIGSFGAPGNDSIQGIDDDAQFVDKDSDWTPLLTANITDAGTLTLDYDAIGRERPQESASDIGAIEFFIDPTLPTECGVLDMVNTTYTLQNDVTSVGTCFIITANNVTFDGQGHTIIYGNTTTNTFFGISSTADETHIKNVTVRRGTLATTPNTRYGIRFSGVSNGIIEDVNASINRQGIRLESGSDSNVIRDTITNGNSDTGIYISGSSDNIVSNSVSNDNTFNGILLVSSSTGNEIYNATLSGNDVGLYFDTSANTNYAENISASGGDFGFYIFTSSSNNITNSELKSNFYSGFFDDADNNRILDSVSNLSTEDAFYLDSGSTGNVFENLTIVATGDGFNDFYVESGNHDTKFLDMPAIGRYQFAGIQGAGSRVIVENSQYGEIKFLGNASGSGTNLSADVYVADNFAEVRSSVNTGLNKSANISLYGSPAADFTNPVVLRDGFNCPSSICAILVDINSATVVFNVTRWTNYSFGEDQTLLDSCRELSNPATYTLEEDLTGSELLSTGCFNITVPNVELDCQGFSIINSTLAKPAIYSNGENTVIRNCNISMSNSSGGYGIELFGANGSSIINNTLSSQDRGVQVNRTSFTVFENNTVEGANKGFYVESGGNNNFTGNTAKSTTGSEAAGIHFYGSSNNLITDNNAADSNSWYGAYIEAGSNSNTFLDNEFSFNAQDGIRIVSSSGNNLTGNNLTDNSQNGIYLFSASGTDVVGNNIDGGQRGIFLDVASTGNNFVDNNVTNSLEGISISSSSGNSFSGGRLFGDFASGIYLTGSDSDNNNFSSISYQGVSGDSLKIDSDGIDGTRFTDMSQITIYNITGAGGTLIVQNTTEGEIKFLEAVNGSGTSFSTHIKVLDNLATVRSDLNPGLNKSANVTLKYGQGGPGFANPAILRNGVKCSSDICTNLTGLNETTVVFNVTHWTNYSLGEDPTLLTDCGTLNQANTIYILQNDVVTTTTCFNIAANNVTFDGQGHTIIYGNQSNVTNFAGIRSAMNETHIRNVSVRRGTLAATSDSRYGIRFLGVRNGTIREVNASLNRHGVFLESSSSFNDISNVIANGNSGDGIFIASGLSGTGNNLTNITANSNTFGVAIAGGRGNRITNLVANSNTNYGISFHDNSNAQIVQNATLNFNVRGISFTGSNYSLANITANSNTDYGIHMSSGSGNNITTFNMDASATTLYGIEVQSSSNNIIEDGLIEEAGVSGIRLLGASSDNNVFRNITYAILNIEDGIVWDTAGIDGTYLIDSVLTNYQFTGAGGKIIVENTTFGEIRFLDSVNGSGFFDTYIVIGNNSATVRSDLSSGLNRSANVTLYDIGDRGFIIPAILRDGEECSSEICTALTSLSAETVVFNVTHWTNYSIGEGNDGPDSPSPVLNSTDGSNRTLQNLHVSSLITDPDGDSLNVSVRWYKNGALNRTDDFNNSYSNGTNFVGTLLSGNTTKGEVWMASMRLYDGNLFSSWANSSNLTIENTPPVVILVSPADGNVTTDRTPTFEWSGSDDDAGDTLTYELNVSLVASSSCFDSERHIINIPLTSHTLSTPLNCLSDNGDYYVWSARAHDGEDFGEWTTVRNISIQSFIEINLIDTNINFGSIDHLASNDTTDDNPEPFKIRNTGNAFVNITVEGTSLWGSVANPNAYFRHKADNRTNSSSFDFASSVTTFTNIPLEGSPAMCIAELNWTSTNNVGDVDIYVEVPPNEPPSVRSSNITFTASLAE